MGDNNDVAETLNVNFPCRKEQIKQLCRFFPRNRTVKLPRLIFLDGESGTGRTAILQQLLDLREDFYVLIDTKECYTKRLLNFHLLYGLYGELEEAFEEVDSLGVVHHHFQRFEDKQKLRCIILKNSEALPLWLLEHLCELQSTLLLEGWNFSFVFISDDCAHIAKLPSLFIRVFFPVYTHDELIEILCKDHQAKDEDDRVIFRNFLQFFLKAISPIYRSLSATKLLVNKFYPVYRKPIEDNILSLNQVAPLSKKLLSLINMNDSSIMFTYADDDDYTSVRSVMDLPLCTKYLVVSAFLASFVPKKMDKIFLPTSTKQRRRGGISKKKDMKSELIAQGPKSFEFSRLITVYAALMGEKTTLNINLISKVAALLYLGLIKPHGDPLRENLTDPTYKCAANPQTVYALAKNIDVDIDTYLSAK